MIKNNKGVTLITLMISIIIMMIIASTLVYNANTWSKTQALNDMYNDITILRDKISLYYSSYGKIPILAEYSNVQNISNINQNDNNKYYVIDLDAIENITLKYGKEYKNLKNNGEDDVYVINELSHNIYYIKGIKVEGKTYYTIPGEYTKVEVPTVSEVKLKKINENVATIQITAINNSDPIEQVGLYVDDNLYKTYNYSETKQYKVVENANVTVNSDKETSCYINVTTESGNTSNSDKEVIKDNIVSSKNIIAWKAGDAIDDNLLELATSTISQKNAALTFYDYDGTTIYSLPDNMIKLSSNNQIKIKLSNKKYNIYVFVSAQDKDDKKIYNINNTEEIYQLYNRKSTDTISPFILQNKTGDIILEVSGPSQLYGITLVET